LEDRAIERERTHSTQNNNREEEISVRGQRRRRAARRPRRRLALWTRVALLGLAVSVMALAVIGLVAKAIRPYREASLQSRQLAETKQQISSLDSENDSLRRRIAYLKTSDGIIVEARKMGYLKSGEIPFVVEGLSQPDEPLDASRVAPEPPNAPQSRAKRLWRRLTGR
jgi:cell division protein FtsB